MTITKGTSDLARNVARCVSRDQAGVLAERVERGNLRGTQAEVDDLWLRASLSEASWAYVCSDEDRKAGRRSLKRCESCRKGFEARRSDARFCSGSCQRKAHRRAA